MFHLSAYFVAAGVNASNTDSAAVSDSIFSQRNNHFIYSEPYNLLGASHLAASATAARFNVPHWNAYARMQIWPVNRSATPPSPPRIDDYRMVPIPIPRNEEIAVEVSNNLGAATEATTTFLWIAPQTGLSPIPGGQRITTRCTSSITRVANSWSGLGALTFAENLRGTWYACIGAYVQTSTCRAFRLNFPRNPTVMGRNLRPGHLVSNALGDLEPYMLPKDGLGVWGVFSVFEPPTIEVYADAAGADTQEVRLDLVYLGEGDAGVIPIGNL